MLFLSHFIIPSHSISFLCLWFRAGDALEMADAAARDTDQSSPCVWLRRVCPRTPRLPLFISFFPLCVWPPRRRLQLRGAWSTVRHCYADRQGFLAAHSLQPQPPEAGVPWVPFRLGLFSFKPPIIQHIADLSLVVA